MKDGWDAVRVEHVDSTGVGDAAEVGAVLSVHAFVNLGTLTPDDVQVQVVHGRADADDVLTGATTAPLAVGESFDGGRYRFDGQVRLDRSGPFGYTVRVIPLNPNLTVGGRAGPGGDRLTPRWPRGSGEPVRISAAENLCSVTDARWRGGAAVSR